jgi:hypothetical protein
MALRRLQLTSTEQELVLLDVRLASTFVTSLIDWMTSYRWKTGVTLSTGRIANPLWSYSLGLKHGFIPSDPRTSLGFCFTHADKLGKKPPPSYAWDGTYDDWMVGNVQNGEYRVVELDNWKAFPPLGLGRFPVSNLPVYTPTGRRLSLVPTPHVSGDGGWYVEAEGCSYPSPWCGEGEPVPHGRCKGTGTGTGTRRMEKSHRSALH